MQLTMEILVSIFLMIGTFFMLVGGIGMVRLPDLFMRLHAPTKSSTLGLGSFLIAAMIYSAFQGRFGFAELLLTLFAFLTAPVSSNLMAHIFTESAGFGFQCQQERVFLLLKFFK